MAALIVGGDRVAVYTKYLQRDRLSHDPALERPQETANATARSPVDTSLVVILIDQVNHGLAKKARRTRQ
jgi:hypothetical protein